jgi:hypothetical protein
LLRPMKLPSKSVRNSQPARYLHPEEDRLNGADRAETLPKPSEPTHRKNCVAVSGQHPDRTKNTIRLRHRHHLIGNLSYTSAIDAGLALLLLSVPDDVSNRVIRTSIRVIHLSVSEIHTTSTTAKPHLRKSCWPHVLSPRGSRPRPNNSDATSKGKPSATHPQYPTIGSACDTPAYSSSRIDIWPPPAGLNTPGALNSTAAAYETLGSSSPITVGIKSPDRLQNSAIAQFPRERLPSPTEQVAWSS